MVIPRRAAHAEESAEVEVLFANLEKLNALTKKIQGSLNRLDTSGKNVQAAIGPVYGNTRVLQTTHRSKAGACYREAILTLVDIDRSIEVIEQFRAPLDRRDEEERILRADPRKVGVSDYISSLERLDRDLRRLQGSNLSANQASIKEGMALVKYGVRQLEDVFKQTLLATGSGGQIEPLHYITKGELPRINENKSN
jgi:exocyst complex component 7